jgi:hypothetical protein
MAYTVQRLLYKNGTLWNTRDLSHDSLEAAQHLVVYLTMTLSRQVREGFLSSFEIKIYDDNGNVLQDSTG